MKKQLVIFGKANCPYCAKAKDLADKFKKDNLIDEVLYLDKDTVNWTKGNIAEAFKIDINKITTVPQIGLLIQNEEDYTMKYIGGYNQLVISDLYIP